MPGGKKWCQVCHINLPYDKKAIQDHQATRRHIQNQQKHIKFQRIKIQRQQKIAKEAAKANSFISTANIPKAKKGSQLQKQVQQYKNDVITSGKMAIHQLIAQKTKGMYGAPIQYPQKQDLVLAQNYQDKNDEEGNILGENQEEEKFQMWKIDICEETGNACFINRISKAKVYEPPKGYIMSQEQKEEWEETKKICDEIPEDNLEQAGQIGRWEQIQEQDYFQQNKAESQNQDRQQNDQENRNLSNPIQDELQVKKDQVKEKLQNNLAKKQHDQPREQPWMEDLQRRIQNNEVNQSQVVGTILTNTLQQCRTVKQKNEALKKLVRDNFEIRATLDKNDEQLLKQEDQAGKKPVGIRPRKKVKTCKIVEQRDIV